MLSRDMRKKCQKLNFVDFWSYSSKTFQNSQYFKAQEQKFKNLFEKINEKES